ncbi:MAG: FmdB family zinc ribbon protein [Actinomycetota bacterium]
MPVYEYKCPLCDQHFDIEQSFTDDTLTTLDGCEVHESGQHQLKKVFSAVGISFKGEGFYKNDSRSSSSSKSSDSSNGDSGSGSSATDATSGSSSASSSGSSDGGSKASSGSSSGSSGSSGSSSD